MWFKTRARIKTNTKKNLNKQTAKSGDIKNSTFQLKTGDHTQGVILDKLFKIDDKLDCLDKQVGHIKRKLDKTATTVNKINNETQKPN